MKSKRRHQVRWIAGGAIFVAPWWFAVLAEGMAITVGLAAGVLPARHAAQMEPVDALRAE